MLAYHGNESIKAMKYLGQRHLWSKGDFGPFFTIKTLSGSRNSRPYKQWLLVVVSQFSNNNKV
jgi:hypothetical protein